MTETSEARKRRAERHAAEHERRREVTHRALNSIMSGATFDDADALLLAYEDEGARVVIS